MSCNVCRGYDSHDCPVCGIDSTIEKCPECEGTGVNHRLAFNIKTRQFVEVNPLTWMLLPVTEEQAEAKDWNFCRAEENCPYCKGLGEVNRDARGELHPMI
jgi:hypothetical protein